MKKILLCGGDSRQIGAFYKLKKLGADVMTYNVSKELQESNGVELKESDFAYFDIIILPLPCSKDDIHLNSTFEQKVSLEEVFSCIRKESRVYGGKLTPYIKGLADRRGIEIFDYLNDEIFSIKNARLTAEAAIELALKHRDRGLFNSDVLVVGFGRIGKCLAHLLKGMGSNVTVAARKPWDRAWIMNFGYNATDITELDEAVKDIEIIFNTVPKWVIEPSVIPSDALYMELASKPYGMDLEKAKELSKNLLLASSLPGKAFPVAAGEIIAETILNSEKQRREE